MGDLISMNRPGVAYHPRPHTGGEAEILFFTGVRYHRLEDETPARTITHSRRRLERAKKDDEIMRPEHQA